MVVLPVATELRRLRYTFELTQAMYKGSPHPAKKKLQTMQNNIVEIILNTLGITVNMNELNLIDKDKGYRIFLNRQKKKIRPCPLATSLSAVTVACRDQCYPPIDCCTYIKAAVQVKCLKCDLFLIVILLCSYT